MQELIDQIKRYSADDIESLISRRKAEDKALHVLWRAALAREREERRQLREGGSR
jgi:hypothetical protein